MSPMNMFDVGLRRSSMQTSESWSVSGIRAFECDEYGYSLYESYIIDLVLDKIMLYVIVDVDINAIQSQ